MIGHLLVKKNRYTFVEMGFFDAKWKKENVVEHKFSDIRITDFKSNNVVLRIKYSVLYALVFKSVGVFVADLFIMYLYFKQLASRDEGDTSNENKVQWAENLKIYIYRPYLYIVSVILSTALLVYEWRNAKKIIRSGDIASAFTSEMASTYYSIRSYSHFCFFQVVSNSTKLRDNLAFFVFFSFKNWKFTAAETPRRILNIVSIFALYQQSGSFSNMFSEATQLKNGLKFEILSTYGSIFTVFLWFLSILRFLTAIAIYIPLITTYIQGSVRGYATHKIDKRITQILHKRKKRMLANEQKKKLLGLETSSSIASENFEATLPDVGYVEEHIVGYDPGYSPHPSNQAKSFDYSFSQGSYPPVPHVQTPTMVSSQVSDRINTMVSSHVSDYNLPPASARHARGNKNSSRPGRTNRPAGPSRNYRGAGTSSSNRTLNSNSSGASTGSSTLNNFEPYRVHRK
eukprot:NODE_2_length_91304_cov_0.692462.p14 type:complete len:458 gc:universal NODE_2_length_91304_cov_0.692462:90026-88653(-)